MISSEKKLLLIWPPYVTPRWFPLGISFLHAYLKKNGAGPVDVFDMNSVYLKEIRPLWGVNAILKNACKVAKKNSLAEGFRDFLDEKRNEVLIHLADLGMCSIPWSLRAIMDSLSGDAAGAARKKVSRMIDPVVRHGGYSTIGISVNYPEQLFFSLLVAQHLKKTLGSSMTIVLGGAQITKHIDYLKDDPRVFDVVDYFVTGDGEEALRRLCLMDARGSLEDIPNLYFKPEGGRVFTASKARFTFEPENFLIPDFSGFDPGNYEAVVPLIITKGCYWSRCAFCTFRHGDGRHFSIGSVEKAMGLLKGAAEATGFREFFFVDDALPPPFMNELASALVRDQVKVTWSANIILDKAFADPEFCRRLKESGLDIVNIGLESVSGRVLRLMNKFHQEMDEAEMEGILKTLKNAGIRIQLNIIFGFPTETLEEARRTLAFLVKNAMLYDFAPMQPFSLEDHTPVADDPARFGITHIHKEDKNFGRRLGYRYDVKEGMTQSQTIRFLHEEALMSVRAALKDKKRRKK